MGRPEKPVDHTVAALGRLAEHLRAMRRAAGVTYDELAQRTNYSAAQLKRAASGAKLPTSDVTRAYVQACASYMDDDPRRSVLEAGSLWMEAAAVLQGIAYEARRSTIVPKPQYVRDEADLSGALRDAWARASRPSMRVLESRSRGQVPRSTAHAICRGRTVPRDFRQFIAFLVACGITGAELRPWYGAWFKVFGMPSDQAFAAALQLLGDFESRRTFLNVYREEVDSPGEWWDSAVLELNSPQRLLEMLELTFGDESESVVLGDAAA
ncbi:helix-turn-helix domain-containing protein [Streptomyces sp. NPDC127063]|uniref:helix-turn-helix domain-containing protein n=1 Tax=Streptomyces sp. NPDC127063 TaxID=3347123 RepID=UPI0036556A88